jgi:hypothetical protein
MDSEITDGNIGAMFLGVQAQDRLTGLTNFADLILRWKANEELRLQESTQKIFEENPQISMLANPHGEFLREMTLTQRTMTASLLTAINACVENLVFSVCPFIGVVLKEAPRWDDAVRELRNKKCIAIEHLQGYWMVKRIHFFSNAFIIGAHLWAAQTLVRSHARLPQFSTSCFGRPALRLIPRRDRPATCMRAGTVRRSG